MWSIITPWAQINIVELHVDKHEPGYTVQGLHIYGL